METRESKLARAMYKTADLEAIASRDIKKDRVPYKRPKPEPKSQLEIMLQEHNLYKLFS